MHLHRRSLPFPVAPVLDWCVLSLEASKQQRSNRSPTTAHVNVMSTATNTITAFIITIAAMSLALTAGCVIFSVVSYVNKESKHFKSPWAKSGVVFFALTLYYPVAFLGIDIMDTQLCDMDLSLFEIAGAEAGCYIPTSLAWQTIYFINLSVTIFGIPLFLGILKSPDRSAPLRWISPGQHSRQPLLIVRSLLTCRRPLPRRIGYAFLNASLLTGLIVVGAVALYSELLSSPVDPLPPPTDPSRALRPSSPPRLCSLAIVSSAIRPWPPSCPRSSAVSSWAPPRGTQRFPSMPLCHLPPSASPSDPHPPPLNCQSVLSPPALQGPLDAPLVLLARFPTASSSGLSGPLQLQAASLEASPSSPTPRAHLLGASAAPPCTTKFVSGQTYLPPLISFPAPCAMTPFCIRGV